MASFHNQLGYEMVVSLADLLGRLAVASDRKVNQYCETPDQAIFMLGLPYPAEATNEQLNIRLQPLYVELLQSISGTSTTRNFDRLDESEEQAILLLYVVEFPLLVLGSRADVSGWSECTNQEHFELTDIARRILGNANILQWCRSLI